MSKQSSLKLPADAVPLERAFRAFVPQELWDKYEEADTECRRLPRQGTIFRSTSIHGEEALHSNRRAAAARAAEQRRKAAWRRIMVALWQLLGEGKLVGYARTDLLSEAYQRVPAATWRVLGVKNVRIGTVTGPMGTLYDLHVADPLGATEGDVRCQGEPEPQEAAGCEPPASETLVVGAEREVVLNHPIAVDEVNRTIEIVDLVRLQGASYELVKQLIDRAAADISALRTPADRTFIPSRKLTESLKISEDALRSRVSACRRTIAAAYRERYGQAPYRDLFIEGTRWAGYRLNPMLQVTNAKTTGQEHRSRHFSP